MESRKYAPNITDIKSTLRQAQGERERETNKQEVNKAREQKLTEIKKNSLYDSKEACEILGVSLQSLRRAMNLGVIKTVRLGPRFIRIPAQELENLSKGEEILLSVEDAAKILNMSKHYIRTQIKTGKIKAFRLARSGPFKILKSEFDKIVKQGF